MKCPRCGAENTPGLPFCRQCWTSFSDVDATAPQRDAAPPSWQPPTSEARGPLFGTPDARFPPPHNVFGPEGPNPFSPSVGPSSLATPPYLPTHPWEAPRAGPSTRAVLACILGVLSLMLFCLTVLTLPVDVAAIVLGAVELRAIQAGQASPAGRAPGFIGIGLAMLALALKALLLFSIHLS